MPPCGNRVWDRADCGKLVFLYVRKGVPMKLRNYLPAILTTHSVRTIALATLAVLLFALASPVDAKLQFRMHPRTSSPNSPTMRGKSNWNGTPQRAQPHTEPVAASKTLPVPGLASRELPLTLYLPT